jgi:DNA (cytosine-5)-methyltransferase 1
MNIDKLTRKQLILKCKELGIKKYSSKKKDEIISMIHSFQKPEILPIKNSVKSFTFIDLFCGIGGFHQAMKLIGGKCVFACDIDKFCRETYEKNYRLKPLEDITKINISDIPDFDILCAGFPCQTFSNAGKKKTFNDKRGLLFDEIIKIIKIKKPKIMFLENVKHIRRVDSGKVYKYIIEQINNSGYYIDEKLVFELSPHQLGIPQQRERIFFVGIRNDIYDKNIDIVLDIPKAEITLDNILEKNIESKYQIENDVLDVLNSWNKMIKIFDVGEKLSPTILCNEFYKTYTSEEFERLPKWKRDYINKNKPIYNKYKSEWNKWYNENKNLLQKREIYGKLEWQTGPKKQNDSIFNYFIQLRQSGIRVKKSKYFPTLVAIVQVPIFGKEKRYITPRECARLQSFPDDFILHINDRISYKQLGNAVNVKVVHKIINTVLEYYKIFEKK